MMRRSLLSSLFVLIATSSLAASPSLNPADAVAFMNQLWNRAAELLNNKTDPTARQARFRDLFHTDFDCAGIARFVLGRYWNAATEVQRTEFVKLFEDYIALAYSTRLAEYTGETFKVTGSRPDADGAIVSSQIIRPAGAQAVKVDWRLTGRNGAYKISDVSVDGISMAVTQRSEFASVIQHKGGQVQGLIAMLREKTASGGAR